MCLYTTYTLIFFYYTLAEVELVHCTGLIVRFTHSDTTWRLVDSHQGWKEKDKKERKDKKEGGGSRRGESCFILTTYNHSLGNPMMVDVVPTN